MATELKVVTLLPGGALRLLSLTAWPDLIVEVLVLPYDPDQCAYCDERVDEPGHAIRCAELGVAG